MKKTFVLDLDKSKDMYRNHKKLIEPYLGHGPTPSEYFWSGFALGMLLIIALIGVTVVLVTVAGA